MKIKYNETEYILPQEYTIFTNCLNDMCHEVYYIAYNDSTTTFTVSHRPIVYKVGTDILVGEILTEDIGLHTESKLYTSFRGFYNRLLLICKLKEMIDVPN